jgi:ABC-type transport system substrate-binding protein
MNDSMRIPARAFFGIILGGALLAAFGMAAADVPRNPSVTNAPIPKRGGTLRLALPTDIASLDPALAFDTVSEPFLFLLYQGLIEYGDGLKLVPCLAKDWNISEDQRTYTFHLRPGVRFSNGREVVASDFVYTMERNLDPKTAGLTESYFEGIVGAKDFRAGKTTHVSGIRAPQSDTLVIELESPDPTFLFILTLPGALVVPREAIEKLGPSFASHPVGTGPYLLTQWRRGVKMRFERNPLFPQADRQYLDAIEVMEGGDSTLRLMMFERGEIDIADITEEPGIPIPDFLRIQRSPRWQGLIEGIPAAFTWFLNLNTEMKPFDDLKVRQAMNYAIDRDKVVSLLHGTVIPAKGILPPPMPGFNPNLTGYPFDPAKARQLLAVSGHPDGFSCKMWYEAGNPLLEPAASALQYDLAQVGIKAQLNPVTLPAFIDSMGRRKTMQCGISAWSQDYPDPSDFLDSMYNGNRITEEGCENIAFYNNPQVNAVFAEAATCNDPEKRIRLYQTAEQTIVSDAPLVPLFYQRVFALRQPWLHGVKLHPVLYFRFERMWLDR